MTNIIKNETKRKMRERDKIQSMKIVNNWQNWRRES